MQTKVFEVRDRMTCLVVLATKFTDPASLKERDVIAGAGYGHSLTSQLSYIVLVKINGGASKVSDDPYGWGDRTLATVHQYLLDHFDAIESGAILDVRVILGEEAEPAPSDYTGYFTDIRF